MYKDSIQAIIRESFEKSDLSKKIESHFIAVFDSSNVDLHILREILLVQDMSDFSVMCETDGFGGQQAICYLFYNIKDKHTNCHNAIVCH